ncbi:MAG: twin-arginine translocation signal domain-containing protein [Pyrinomonadaceae bacterium]
MDDSRRKFLKAGALAALVAGAQLKSFTFVSAQQIRGGRLNPAGDFQVPQKSQADIINYFSKETFAPYLSTSFRASLKTAPGATLKLIEVNDLKASRKHPETVKGFSLIFSGPKSKRLEPKIYTIEHDALGRFSLFLTPVEREAGRLFYEAVFNRIP